MFLKQSNSVFLLFILMSTILVISSSSWAMAWMGLEINLMSIIPLLIKKGELNSNSTAIKYFLTQVMASMILIFSFNMFYMMNFSNMLNMFNELVMISMAMKAGMPPFHFWLPQVLETSTAMEMMIILSWQKIAPMIMFSYCLSKMITLLIMLSAMIGALGGFNQNSLKKIMAFSSMIDGSWMISSMIVKQETWMMYFLIYSMMLLVVCITMNVLNINKISDIPSMNMTNNNKILIMTNLLSMGGLPPFSGFFAKIIVFILLMNNTNMFFMLMVLVFSSMVSLYFYLKVTYSCFLMSSKKIMNSKYNKSNNNLIFYITTLNILSPMMFYLT